MGSTVSAVPLDAPRALRELDRDVHITKCTAVASLSIAVYDYVVCLGEEIDLVWTASHSVFKYLALFSRYTALVVPLGIVTLRLGDWSSEQCLRMKPLGSVASTLSILSTNYVLGLRTAAVYSYQRAVSLVIGTVLLAHTVLAIWATTQWITIDLPPEIPGCFPRPGERHSLGLSMYWIPAAITDVVLFALTVFKVFPIWSGSKESRLSFIILRDEILASPAYYGLISSLTVATPIPEDDTLKPRVRSSTSRPPSNVLLYVGSPALGPILAPLSLTLSPVLVFHLVLNLRSVSRYPYHSSQEAAIPIEDVLASTYVPSAATATADARRRHRPPPPAPPSRGVGVEFEPVS
ncbi:hypothetical protein JCM11491_004875 [Sporobolomyces phaffii]